MCVASFGVSFGNRRQCRCRTICRQHVANINLGSFLLVFRSAVHVHVGDGTVGSFSRTHDILFCMFWCFFMYVVCAGSSTYLYVVRYVTSMKINEHHWAPSNQRETKRSGWGNTTPSRFTKAMNLVINFQLLQGQPRSFIMTLCYYEACVYMITTKLIDQLMLLGEQWGLVVSFARSLGRSKTVQH